MASRADLRELAGVFLKLGVTAFGGPAVHIAMLEEEVVERRKWLAREQFLDLLGVTNLIPGPNSTEMASHIGLVRAGWPGFLTAGICFILPAVLITGACAWVYVNYGLLPQAAPFRAGIGFAVPAIIAAATLRLGKTAVRGWRMMALAFAVALASLLGANEIVALLGGGLAGVLWLYAAQAKSPAVKCSAAPLAALLPKFFGASGGKLAALAAGAAGAAASLTLWKLGLFFLKVGAVLYGSGYVLVAYLEGGLVRDYAWLTEQQLLDAIAIGQFTPGPVLSTATLVGYLIAGWEGVVVATVAIFLPSFFLVALIGRILPHIRKSPLAGVLLDAVNASSIALMAAVSVKLALATLTSWPAWVLAAAALVLAFRWKVNAAWLILGGAVAGWAVSVLA